MNEEQLEQVKKVAGNPAFNGMIFNKLMDFRMRGINDIKVEDLVMEAINVRLTLEKMASEADKSE